MKQKKFHCLTNLNSKNYEYFQNNDHNKSNDNRKIGTQKDHFEYNRNGEDK